MHLNEKKFNGRAKQLTNVSLFIDKYKPASLIDYGCSKGHLIAAIAEKYEGCRVAGYDPGLPEFENLPEGEFDVLISTDVLEHIEPEHIDATLQEINKLFTKAAYLIIASYPAKKYLPDGRNAHLIIENADWWRNRLQKNIAGAIVEFYENPMHAQPKKGPAITGFTYVVIIEK